MKFPTARSGEPLRIGKAELDFSFFMVKTGQGSGGNSVLYAADPWGVILGSVAKQVTGAGPKSTAISFVHQSQEFYSAADNATNLEARPLLYYYSFLNLAKALVACRSAGNVVGPVKHGVSHAPQGSGSFPQNENIKFASGQNSVSDLLHVALTGASLPSSIVASQIKPIDLMYQSVVAHRMLPARAGVKEKFRGIEKIELLCDRSAKIAWVNLYIKKNVHSGLMRDSSTLLRESSLHHKFKAAAPRSQIVDMLMLEQVVPVAYQLRIDEALPGLIELLKPNLWQTVNPSRPYRRFYLLLSDHHEIRFPQWLSVYGIFFWLGSMTRYYPTRLIDLVNSKYGPFVREFLATQPAQLLYILASEFAKRDLTRADLV